MDLDGPVGTVDSLTSERHLDIDTSTAADPHAESSRQRSQGAPSSSLEPFAYRDRVRELQQALLASPDQGESPRLIQSLVSEYARAAQDTGLLPHEWLVYLALALQPHQQTGLSSSNLEQVLTLHSQSFQRLIDARLVSLYISLLLHYFGLYSGIVISSINALPQETHDQQEPSQSRRDLLQTWTGLSAGPLIDIQSSSYLLHGLPPLANQTDAGLEELLGPESVRARIREAYSRCAYHLTESQAVWKLHLAFEEALLASGKHDAVTQTEMIKQVFLARLRVPHKDIDDTFQAYSHFVTNHMPAEVYESELSAANKAYAFSKQVFSEREQYEDSLAALDAYQRSAETSQADISIFRSHWKPYLLWQQKALARTYRGKDKALAQINYSLACGLFERAIVQFGAFPPRSAEEEQCQLCPPNAASLAQQKERLKTMRRVEKDRQKEEGEQRFAERLSIAEGLWLDYVSALHLSTKPDSSLILDVCDRSIHLLPTSHSLHATYMRQLSRFSRPKNHVEEVFARIVNAPGTTEKGAALVDLLVARIDCERESATRELATTTETGQDVDPATNMDKFTEVYALISYGLGETAKLAPSERDATLRLERYAVDWVERAIHALGGPDSEAGASLNDLAESVWQNAVKAQSENARLYREAAAYWTRRNDARKARGWYKGGVNKFERSNRSATQDNAAYERLLDDWLQFEHQRGRIEDVDYAVSKTQAERERLWQAWYATYAAQQEQAQQYGLAQPQEAAIADVDMAASATEADKDQNGVKRKPEDEASTVDLKPATTARASSGTVSPSADVSESIQADPFKKARHSEEPARDRENSSVLIAGMPSDISVGAIRSFLRDCGRIQEINGPRTLADPSTGEKWSAALIEFADRTGAASARTRDMKKLHDVPVSVNLGWQCTLFVTNFPEEWDDAEVRRFFGRYGAVFDVRWPSRKYVSTRRFVYVQYTLPAAADAALQENGTALSETCTLSVALSDPSRRKQRSDADANARELFVSGFPRFVVEEDLRKHFEPFGEVTAVRMPTQADGKVKGTAFVDFASTLDAQRAMKERNGSRLKGKVIAVTLALSRGAHGTVVSGGAPRSSSSMPPSSAAVAPVGRSATAGAEGGGENGTAPSIQPPSHTTVGSPSSKPNGTNRAARRAALAEDRKSRTLHLRPFPADAQEALIQQSVEKVTGGGSVKRVFWTEGDERGEATVEFHDAKVAGRLALEGGVRYGERQVAVVGLEGTVGGKAAKGEGEGERREVEGEVGGGSRMFVPRPSRARGRGRGRGAGRTFVGRSDGMRAGSTAGGESDLPAGTEAMDVDAAGEGAASRAGEASGAKNQDAFRAMLSR